MTIVPATFNEPDHRLHQIDAALSVLVRLLARQAVRELCPKSELKDAQEDDQLDQD